MMGRNLIIPPLLSVSGMAMFVTATGLCRPPVFTLAERLIGVGVALLTYVAGFVLASREESQRRRETEYRPLTSTANSAVRASGNSLRRAPPEGLHEFQLNRCSSTHPVARISTAWSMERTRTSHERRRVEHHSYEPSH